MSGIAFGKNRFCGTKSQPRWAGLLFAVLLPAYLLTLTIPLAVVAQQASVDVAPGQRLTEQQLRQLLVGNTEVGSYLWKGQWIGYREYFRPDGVVAGSDDYATYTGTWRFEGDMICGKYSEGGSGCWYYVSKGGNEFDVYYSDGTVKVRIYKVEKGKKL